jgi:hypothetical protein
MARTSDDGSSCGWRAAVRRPRRRRFCARGARGRRKSLSDWCRAGGPCYQFHWLASRTGAGQVFGSWRLVFRASHQACRWSPCRCDGAVTRFYCRGRSSSAISCSMALAAKSRPLERSSWTRRCSASIPPGWAAMSATLIRPFGRCRLVDPYATVIPPACTLCVRYPSGASALRAARRPCRQDTPEHRTGRRNVISDSYWTLDQHALSHSIFAPRWLAMLCR